MKLLQPRGDIVENKSPGKETDLSKGVKLMSIPCQYDNKDYGKRSKLVRRKISMTSSGRDGKFYGARTIMTKEDKVTFIGHLIQESTDLSAIPDSVYNEIKSNVRKGAKDLAQQWRDALELLHRAYYVTGVRRPTPTQKGGWKQYEELIQFAVKQLRATRGVDGKWRTSPVMIPEAAEAVDERPIGKRRFFVEIPGDRPREIDADNMDDIIDSIANKLRREGAKLRIETRDKFATVATVWVGDVMRERIVIKEL